MCNDNELFAALNVWLFNVIVFYFLLFFYFFYYYSLSNYFSFFIFS